MKGDQIKTMSERAFRRLTGVKRSTFEAMREILSEALKAKKRQGGRPNKLTVEEMILMTLEYLREYRTYFHVSQSYGLSESSAYKVIRRVEDTLIQSGRFSLPGRKALLKSDITYEVVLIDATETPIERPKKSGDPTTRERRNVTP